MKLGRTNRELLFELDRMVWGHDQAKRTLINLLSRIRIRYLNKYGYFGKVVPKEELLEPKNILLVGGSGTGKTYLLQSLQGIIGFPLICIDASRLNLVEGIQSGTNVKDIIGQIHNNAETLAGSKEFFHSKNGVLDQTVVFLDEFDKLLLKDDSGWDKKVQAQLLTMLEDRNSYLSGVTFILAGAFSNMGIYDTDNAGRKPIGFSRDNTKLDEDNMLDTKLIKAGMLPEIVGRLGYLCQLDVLTAAEYKRILLEKLCPRKRLELRDFNVDNFMLDDETIDTWCQEAVKSGQGVRYLKRKLEETTLELEFDFEEREYSFLAKGLEYFEE